MQMWMLIVQAHLSPSSRFSGLPHLDLPVDFLDPCPLPVYLPQLSLNLVCHLTSPPKPWHNIQT